MDGQDDGRICPTPASETSWDAAGLRRRGPPCTRRTPAALQRWARVCICRLRAMCGIVGYVATRVEPGLDAGYLARACETLRHRGPDGEGVWVDGAVGLGHRRLSIIDLTTGTQPMSYAGGRYWITFNGEIYNYRELRQTLAGRGHEFRTTSDTEVILAAFAEWG